jgi:hypothetical protein
MANSLTQNVSSCGSLNLDLESLASLNDTNLTRLHVQHAKFSLNIERTLLRHDQEVAIRVHKSLLGHATVGEESMNRKSLAESWVSRPRDALEACDEIDVAIGWDVKGKPRKLRGR